MLKEFIICIIILFSIIFGNFKIQQYTNESITAISNNLNELREEILINEDNMKNNDIKNKIGKVWKEWENRHDKLAYFIEHNELEKVETNLTALKSYAETEEFKNYINELDKSVFLLNHIQDKYAFNLTNIF